MAVTVEVAVKDVFKKPLCQATDKTLEPQTDDSTTHHTDFAFFERNRL
jgi:hypothetical protein